MVEQYDLLPRALVRPFARALPVVELAGALGLLLPATRPPAAALLILLLLVFAAAMAINLVRGRSEIDCGCFIGVQKQRIGWTLVVRNLALAAFGLTLLGAGTGRPLAALDWFTVLAAAASLLVLYEALGRLFGLGPRSRRRRAEPMEPLVVSQIILWLVVVVLALTVAALVRQIGVLHERVAPLGALTTRTAVEVGQPAPQFDVIDLAGRPVRIGGERGRAQPAAAVRLAVLPDVQEAAAGRALVRAQRAAGRRDRADGRRRPAFARGADRGAPAGRGAVRAGPDRRHQSRHRPPAAAVLIDPAGVIRSKGIVNSREHLESLLVAQETGYASMQDYLRGSAPMTAGVETRQPEDGRISA